jgi:hypothetical protein
MYAMKAYGVMAVQQHSLRMSSRSGHFTTGQGAPGTQKITGWVDTRAGLNAWQKRKFLYPAGNRATIPWSFSLAHITVLKTQSWLQNEVR